MALKARARPTWRKGRNRSGLPTPPGFKFMTVAQRRASEGQSVAKARGKPAPAKGEAGTKTAAKAPPKPRKKASGKAAG